MSLYIKRSGDLVRCHGCLTDGQTLKDRATQLLINAIKLFSFFLGDHVYHTQSEYIIDQERVT